MSDALRCKCGRDFTTEQGLGSHWAWVRRKDEDRSAHGRAPMAPTPTVAAQGAASASVARDTATRKVVDAARKMVATHTRSRPMVLTVDIEATQRRLNELDALGTAEFVREAEERRLRARIRLLSRLLCEYMADHNDRLDEELSGARNQGCACVLCDRAGEVLK